MAAEARVLSIQSHVVSGYVGNKSATFPLQVLGLEVDAINSVQFSNHTGYKHFKGTVMNASELSDLLEGLELNCLSTNSYTHLLTGYIGSESFLRAAINAINKIKKNNPNLTYVCDPVMGDDGKMYVPKELLPIYRNDIVPLADIITPNQYEAELLSELSIKTEEDVGPVMDWFHKKGVKIVVLSSTDLGNDQYLIGMASSMRADGTAERIRIAIPRFPVNFTGTGDLFAALLLAWLHRTQNNIKESVEKTVATMQSVLQATLTHAVKSARGVPLPKRDSPEYDSLVSSLTPRDRELRLIQSIDTIRNPNVLINATEL